MRDLREAFRQLRRRPIFTAAAVLTLAIGIGVNAVAFSVVNGIVLRGFATKAKSGVGRIITTPGSDEGGNASLSEYERFAEATRGSLDLGAEGRLSMAWRHDGTTETAWVLAISPNYFSLVDAPAIAGELRVQRSAGSSPTVVIGERFWRQKLASASLSGLTLRLNNADVSVSGVISDAFTGPAGLYSPDVWVPLDDLSLFSPAPALEKRDTRWLFVLGLLQPDASAPQVQTLIDTAAATMAREWPDTHKGRGARFHMLGEQNSEMRGLSRGAAIGMGIIGLVLLLACFNVASLLLAQAVERERDMGIRASLGARPGRLLRLVITEGLVLATISGILALVLAWWTQSLVSSFAIPLEEPQHLDVTPDLTVVGFTLLLVAIAGVLPGLWPAIAAARVNVVRVLSSQGGNTAGGRPSPVRRWLVAAQVAGSTVFLALAALFLQSYSGIAIADFGFDREHLVVAQFDPSSHGYSPERAAQYADALRARVSALPGVTDATVANHAPFFIGFGDKTPIWPAGGTCVADECASYSTFAVDPGYFRTMGIALVEGREFNRRAESTGVVINQAMARKQFPSGGGLGEVLRIGASGTAVTVIGITAKTHTRGLDREEPTLFLPLSSRDFETGLTMVVRTSAPPSSIVRPLVEAADTVDPNVSMLAVKTMDERMAVQFWPFRTLSWIFSICGSLALILATVGLAGVVIHAVNRRIREFGVRVSLGATPRDVLTVVLKDTARLLGPGLVVGMLLAVAAARLIQVVFIGVNVLNPTAYLVVALAESAIVIAACIAPALRAARVDPLVALRAE
jgi:putative ABC transport system permease protein